MKVFFLISPIILLSFFFNYSVIFSQENGEESQFRISKVQPEDSGSFVTFVVTGEFEQKDILNLYINDSFITNTVVESSNQSSAEIARVPENALPVGSNQTLVRLQRGGIEVAETPVRIVNVRDRLNPPTVSIEEPQEGVPSYRVVITGNFRENAVIALYNIEGSEVYQKIVTTEEVESGEVVIPQIGPEDLSFNAGENTLRAEVRIDNLKSGLGPASNFVVVLGEGYTPKPEPISVPVVVRDTSFAIPQCFDTSFERIELGDSNEAGLSMDIRDGLIAIGTDENEVFIYENRDGRNVQVGYIELEYDKGRSDLPIDVAVVNRNEIIVGVPFGIFNGSYSGSVHRYTRNNSVWTGTQISIPNYSRGNVGRVVATDGETLAITDTDTLYVYSRERNYWIISGILNSTADLDAFGELGVFVHDGKVAVTSNDDNRKVVVSLFSKVGTSWNEDIILLPNGEATYSDVIFNDANLFVSNTDGDVFVLNKTNDSWNLSQEISVGKNIRKKVSLAFSHPYLLVGVLDEEEVILYENKDGVWIERKVIIPKEEDKIRFGTSIGFGSDTIFISAPKENNGVVYEVSFIEKQCESNEETENVVPLSLKEERDVLESTRTQIQSLIDLVTSRINLIIEEEKLEETQKETYIIVDPQIVNEDVQRQAAVRRGIIGPSLTTSEIVIIRQDTDVLLEEVGDPQEVIKESGNNVLPVYSSKDLRLGDVNEDVARLQAFLNNNGYTVAESGPGSPGKETTVFDENTENALSLFQFLSGITITGVLDSETRNTIYLYGEL